jgi:putative glutamine amidotransferase
MNVNGEDTNARLPAGAEPDGPRIAIVGQLRRNGGRIPAPYANAVVKAGGLPHVYSPFGLIPDEDAPAWLGISAGLDPYDDSALDQISGLVIPGGGDIDPAWYGKPRHPRTTNVSHRRDLFETSLLKGALERDMPVLAICHGMQLLNVHLGGTIVQHLRDDPRVLQHDRDMPRAEPAHDLRVKEGSRFAEIIGAGNHIQVNSHHHQGLGAVPHCLEQVGWAEDGVLEAVIHRDRTWVVGVQWHPEAMAPVDAGQRHLFRSFVEAAEQYAERVEPAAAQSA